MKISCPKLKTNKLLFLLLLIPIFLVSYFIFNHFPKTKKIVETNNLINTQNLVQASITSTTPIANFPTVNGTVYATAVSSDGSTLYIGGEFSYVEDFSGGDYRDNLAAIDLETMLLTDWNPINWNEVGPVYDIVIDGDYVLIGGSFYYNIGNYFGSQFVKIHQENDELIDEACPSVINWYDFSRTVYDIELTDDYIYLGGSFDEINGFPIVSLARLHRDTCQLDQTWLPDPWSPDPWSPESEGVVLSIEAVGDDVLVGGGFEVFNDQYTGEFVKLSGVDGSRISSCYPMVLTDEPIILTVYDIEATAEHIYLGGSFNSIEGVTRNGLARLTNDDNCALDINWNPNPDGPVYTINIDETDDSVYVGGSFNTIGGQTGSEFAKLDIDTGLVDVDWNPEIWTEQIYPSTVYSSLITDNYLIVGGSFNRVEAEEVYSLAAFPYQLPPSPTPESTTQLTITPEPTNQPGSSSSSKPEYIQIPGAIKELFTNTIITHPIKDSNTRGQQVLSIIFPETFNFNAYLSSSFKPASHLSYLREKTKQDDQNYTSNLLIAGWSGGELMGFREKGTIYWQVSDIQQIFYKAYPASGKDAPIIIPELQSKDSIIALKYNDADLIPPGEPDTRFNESTLRLAYSLDGINWSVMSSSVVDTTNNTVAAIGKVAGYYTIVGRY